MRRIPRSGFSFCSRDSRTTCLPDPTTSDEAKANAQAKLAELGVDGYGATGAPVEDDEHSHRVLGGFKATLSSTYQVVFHGGVIEVQTILARLDPTTSDEAKEKAAEKLRLAGVEP